MGGSWWNHTLATRRGGGVFEAGFDALDSALDKHSRQCIYHKVYITSGLDMNDPLSAKFAALADPTRRAMLARLALGELTLADLAKPLEMTVPAVAKHLAVLERAGFVTRSRPSRSVARPAKLQVGALSEMADWIEKCRAHWEGSFDRLALYLETPEARGAEDV
jgi:DNA-binding transcriptional ArsR family regulator